VNGLAVRRLVTLLAIAVGLAGASSGVARSTAHFDSSARMLAPFASSHGLDGHGTSILVVRTIHRVDRLYALNPATGVTRRLRPPLALATSTTGVFAARNPSWSPDGAFVAFEDDKGSLFVMKQDGSGKRELTDGSSGADVDAWNWSPSGDLLVFSANTPHVGDDAVWITHGNGPPTMIVQYGSDPQWRSDGMILFDDECAEKTCGQLFALPPDGGTPTFVADDVFDWFVSPDGKEVAFDDFMTSDFQVMTAWGRNRRTLVRSDPFVIAWAPDSRRLAFNTVYHARALHVADLRSGTVQNILRHPIRIRNRIAEIDNAFWNPSGNELAVQAAIHIGPARNGSDQTSVSILALNGRMRTLLTGPISKSLLGLSLSSWERAARVARWER
jgi:dipeptidyl aminopeptidase/acylaminoacyl peptidase